jgi:hypothetical protein
MSMAQRRCRIIGGQGLSKLTLGILSFMVFACEAVADPNLLVGSETGNVPALSPNSLVTVPGVATVTANQDDRQAVIPSTFIGFSDENQDVIADTIFTPTNTSPIC